MESNTYGYVRVSTQEQNEARQLSAMREFGVREENIIVEKLSGKDFQRPLYHVYSSIRNMAAKEQMP